MPHKKRKGSQSQNKADQSRTEVLNESVRNKSVRENEVEESMDCEEGNDLETSFTAADSIPTSGHSRLLNGLETPEKFIQLIDAHRSKKDDFDLEEVIPILTSDEQNAMWSRLANFVKTACEHLSQENSFANQPEAENNLEEISTNVLSGVALVCRLCLGLEDVINSPSQYLRETLNHFSTHILHVKHQIGDAFSRCIELWYTSSMEDREDLALSSLKFLLKKIIVEKSGAKNDVKRVWSLHQILLSLRLEECGLKEDLLSCFSSSLFLTTQPEGIKFLAHLFTLSVQFTQDICKQIKQSLITLTAKQSYNLGEVYMKAWAQSGGAFRTLLEDNLQKLMDEGMLVNRVKHLNLAKNVASFLHCFHDNKQNSELKTLLANLYAPFIWRYIKCSNMNVRQNALDIFLSAYPIENLSLSKQEREAEIDKQNLLLRNLLMDSVVEIRSRTLVGLGRILANYWLLLSSETINSFMEPIIKELAFDSVSKVRVRVYECIKSILDTSYSHVYMKEILPKLKLGLHDTNECVRVAFVDLLLAVKSIKIIRYWDICPLENLLAQMELDKPVVANSIAKLLIPSIFPKLYRFSDLQVVLSQVVQTIVLPFLLVYTEYTQLAAGSLDGTTEDLLNRAIKLQQTNKKAARKFYFIVPAMVEKERLIELVYAILDSVRHYLKSKNSDKENMGASGKKKKKLYNKSVLNESAESTMDSTSTSSLASTVIASESESRIQEDHLYNDMELVGGLLDSVCVLWYNLNQELAEEL